MPRATVWIECKFELADPEDYPLSVQSWEDAARHEVNENLSVLLYDGDVEVSWGLAAQGGPQITGTKEFKREWQEEE